MALNQGLALHTKSSRFPKFPEVKERVLSFVRLARAAKMPVTQDLIQQRALLVRDEIIATNCTYIDKDYLRKFSSSIG